MWLFPSSSVRFDDARPSLASLLTILRCLSLLCLVEAASSPAKRENMLKSVQEQSSEDMSLPGVQRQALILDALFGSPTQAQRHITIKGKNMSPSVCHMYKTANF